MTTKAYKHFKRRLKDRYGIDLTPEIYANIVWQIQHDHLHTFVRRTSNKRTVHRVLVQAAEVFVVYRGSYGGTSFEYPLLTALPPTQSLKDAYQEITQ